MPRVLAVWLVTLFLAFPVTAHAWYTTADFETGGPADPAEGPEAFDTARDTTYLSNSYARNGTQSAEARIATGGTSGMGGTFFFDDNPGEGGELYFRAAFYFPAGFDLSATGAGLKLVRFEIKDASGANEGFHNVLVRPGGIAVTSQVSGSTLTGNNPVRTGLGGAFPVGRWVVVETYFRFSATGGTWRIWRDGELVFNDERTHTLRTSASYALRALVFSYWNGGAPTSQSAYIDDCALTNETPSDRDSAGNPFIGVGTASPTAVSDAGTPSSSDAGMPGTADAGGPASSDAGTPTASDASMDSDPPADAAPVRTTPEHDAAPQPDGGSAVYPPPEVAVDGGDSLGGGCAVSMSRRESHAFLFFILGLALLRQRRRGQALPP